jgi:hypothetical protein
MSIHKWQGRPISSKDHHADLERDAAALEFGASRLDRKAAEEGAYQAYKRKQHSDAVAHHLSGMRSAMSSGRREDGEKHAAMYEAHMKALGLRRGSLPPNDSPTPHEKKSRFSAHPADQLLVSHSKSEHITKSEPETDGLTKAAGYCKWRLGERRCQRKVSDGDYCHFHIGHWANRIKQFRGEED